MSKPRDQNDDPTACGVPAGSLPANLLPWTEWEAIIRRDPGGRGVASFVFDDRPLGCGELERAAVALARAARRVAIVTGFCIADADPPAAETDGPPGAMFLARALAAVGVDVVILSDAFGTPLLAAGMTWWNLRSPQFEIVEMPMGDSLDVAWADALIDLQVALGLTHVVAIERAGPSHTVASVAEREGAETAERFASEVPPEHRDAHHNMRGIVIDRFTAPAGQILERIADRHLAIDTIGIGDGGNEIGMGKFPWSVLCKAIRVGPSAQTACRVATNHAIVAGVSNWGAYALALAVVLLRGRADLVGLWTSCDLRLLIERIVAAGAVDGVTRRREVSVDGLAIDDYLSVFESLRVAALNCAAAAE